MPKEERHDHGNNHEAGILSMNHEANKGSSGESGVGAPSSDQRLELTEALRCREREMALLQQAVRLSRAEVDAVNVRQVRQLEHQRYLVQQLRGQVEELRVARDDLALESRAMRQKLLERRMASPKGGSSASGELAVPWRSSDSGRVRVAGIMDEFTTDALKPSCQLCAVDLKDWQAQLETFRPQILFVESAWHGNGGQWTRKVSHPSKELRRLLEWCGEQSIPTVFWNKEDPVHFDTFLNTARLFDHVFTTDIDCIGRYKTFLRHERVYLMPFWGQPRLHNPIERFQRKPGTCFAGAYYMRYPERQRDFDVMIDVLAQLAPVVIFDRNHGKDDPNYKFPDRYAQYIQGNLPYAEIDRAYKGYSFGINLNSVKQSQSMFARRAFDLLLSNTHVVSNYSRGLRLMLGDLVTSTDDAAEITRQVVPLLSDEGLVSRRRMHRLLGLRKVMLEHTAEDRLAYVLSKAGITLRRYMPTVIVAAAVSSDSQLTRVLSAYDRQLWPNRRLVVVLQDGYVPSHRSLRREVSYYTQRDAEQLHAGDAWRGETLAFFSSDDFYGANYLTDATLAFLYSDADVVGKGAWYDASDGGLRLHGDGCQYHWQESLPARRALAKAGSLCGSTLWDWVRNLDQRNIRGESCLALDEFSYVANARGDAWPDLEEPRITHGLPIASVLEQAERIQGLEWNPQVEHGLDARSLWSLLGGDLETGSVRLKWSGDSLLLRSTLDDSEHKYLYAKRPILRDELTDSDEITFHLVVMPGVRVDLALIFLAENGDRLGQVIKPAGQNHGHILPVGTHHIRLALRVLGPGSARVLGLSQRSIPELRHDRPQLGRARVFLLTNIYPSQTHLYRNGFVHRRVLGYKEAGLDVDVFAHSARGGSNPHAYEFEGVDVNSGGNGELIAQLDSSRYDTVLVHFLNPAMWAALKPLLHRTRVIVWVHGAEVQPWHRREFNFDTEMQLAQAKLDSDARIAFWREVLTEQHPNLHFVFVSRYFYDEVTKDVGVDVPSQQVSIIHNFIDNSLFRYEEKCESQRCKVLSIRPFASRKYANDLSVRAILALRDKPFFSDMEFRVIGEGPLFDETVAPIRGLDNVHLEQRFLKQNEIAMLHREYGVFLCPTRMDSQGVSRDEAMSSGLVPVTNAVAAIPEFVDEQCGILAPGEGWQEMAIGMEELVQSPERFLAMSVEAARRVREQSSFEQTIKREAELIAQGRCL